MAAGMRAAPLAVAALLFAAAAHAGTSVQEPPDDAIRDVLREAVMESVSFTDRFEAEVWLMDMSNRLQRWLPNDVERINLLKLVHYEATRVRLPPELVLAVIDVESKFDRFAISRAGAQGLMQVMPFWLNEIGRPNDNLFNVQTNLRFGCTILRYYLDKEKGNLTRALARYNGSLGKLDYPTLVFNALNRRWYRQ
ncbi:MAG: transglycosylase SLT domain-containing protein [Gammaproteobacteria bacterium]